MVDKKTPEWYSNELNKMFGLEGENKIDFTKLTQDDLIAFYFYIKMVEEGRKRGVSASGADSPFRGTLLEGTLIDGPLLRKVVGTLSAKEMEGLKERPLVKVIIAKAADGMDK